MRGVEDSEMVAVILAGGRYRLVVSLRDESYILMDMSGQVSDSSRKYDLQVLQFLRHAFVMVYIMV